MLGILFDVLLSLLRTYFNFITGDPILGIICTIAVVAAGWWVLDNI
jgi:hypothetical protein